MRPLAPRVLAEMFGAFVLIFFGTGSVVMNSFPNGQYGVFGIGMAHALALAIGITATMSISGGHLNPAVTIGLFSIRKISAVDAFAYVVAQLAGGLLGALAVKTFIAPNVGRVVGFGAPSLHNTVSFTDGIAIEAILTFFLMSAVMGTAVSKLAPKVGGFAIGLTLLPAIIVGGPLTGAALNPARAFGPAVIAGNMQAQAVWWAGPIIGAVAAALLWNYVLLKGEEAAA
jgi:MIP family channel proteins